MPKKSSNRKKAIGATAQMSASVSCYPPLQAWLNKNNARRLWQMESKARANYDESPDMAGPQMRVEGWMINQRLVLIIVNANKMGWEIYTSPDTVAIDATLLDAERRLSIKE